jgi:ribosomal protein S18 acetylase RimI-like enzyme
MAVIDEIAYRTMDEDAFPWVISSWKESYRDYWTNRNWENRREYYDVNRPIIEAHIEELPPLLAVLKEEPDEYMGFVCGSAGHLYYVYVKYAYRRDGIASALIEKVCGDKGRYHWETEKVGFLKALERKGWSYEKDE